MSSVVNEHVVMAPLVRARLVLAARVRSLRLALEDVEAARRGGLLMFAVPGPDLASLSDLDLLVTLLRDPTRLPQVSPSRIPVLIGLVRLFEAKLVWGQLQPLASPTPSVGTEESSLIATDEGPGDRLSARERVVGPVFVSREGLPRKLWV
jgi:hypothetical protein